MYIINLLYKGLTGRKSLPEPVDAYAFKHKEEITTNICLLGPFPLRFAT